MNEFENIKDALVPWLEGDKLEEAARAVHAVRRREISGTCGSYNPIWGDQAKDADLKWKLDAGFEGITLHLSRLDGNDTSLAVDVEPRVSASRNGAHDPNQSVRILVSGGPITEAPFAIDVHPYWIEITDHEGETVCEANFKHGDETRLFGTVGDKNRWEEIDDRRTDIGKSIMEGNRYGSDWLLDSSDASSSSLGIIGRLVLRGYLAGHCPNWSLDLNPSAHARLDLARRFPNREPRTE